MSEEEFLSTIKGLFDLKSSEFRKVFDIITGLSLIFFILILLASSYVEWLEHSETIELEQIQQEISVLVGARDKIGEARNGTESAANALLVNRSLENESATINRFISLGTMAPSKS